MRRAVKNIANTFRKASAFDEIRETSGMVIDQAKGTFSKKKIDNVPVNSFEKLEEIGINDDVLTERYRLFKRFVLFYICCTAAILGLATFFLISKDYHSMAVAFCAMFIFIAQAFKFHFWCFQIKTRRLGCKFSDWLGHLFNKEA